MLFCIMLDRIVFHLDRLECQGLFLLGCFENSYNSIE